MKTMPDLYSLSLEELLILRDKCKENYKVLKIQYKQTAPRSSKRKAAYLRLRENGLIKGTLDRAIGCRKSAIISLRKRLLNQALKEN